MTAPGPDGDDLTKDIIGVDAYEAPRPPQKRFKPWHRPRKHYVRKTQWAVQIAALVDARKTRVERIRYLGLPGVDLLDLRHIHDAICSPRNLRLSFLGFNDAIASNGDSQTEINISLDEVMRLPLVEKQSQIIPDDIRGLSNPSSIGHQTARSLGPYDVVNLDLCDGFGKQQPGIQDDSHYNALREILSIQLSSPHPWLLFLTTRVGPAHVHEKLLAKFQTIYANNLNGNAFREASADQFGVGDENGMISACETERGHANVFLTALCKWLSMIVIKNNPAAHLDVMSVLGYKVFRSASCEDLISCAFRFVPQRGIINDPAGVAFAMDDHKLDEGLIAVQSLLRIAQRSDVDALLAANENLHREMVEETAALLELARYS